MATATTDIFRPEVLEQTISTIRLAWPAVAGTDVYKVMELRTQPTDDGQLSRRVYWGSAAQCRIAGLECNFCYAFEVHALAYGGAQVGYTLLRVSEIVKANTLAPPPNALSMHRAIRNRHEFLLKRFLTARPDLLCVPCPHNGMLPLCAAVSAGNKDLVDVMLRLGADAGAPTPLNGRTPLQLALFGGHVSIAKTLAERGAARGEALLLRWRDCAGLTAAEYAVDGGDETAVRFMLELYADELRDADKTVTMDALLRRAVQMHSAPAIVGVLLTHARSESLSVEVCVLRKMADATGQMEIVEMLDAFAPPVEVAHSGENESAEF